MSRRHLAYAVLVVASFIVAGCAEPTGPRSETITCSDGSVVVVGSGVTCPE